MNWLSKTFLWASLGILATSQLVSAQSSERVVRLAPPSDCAEPGRIGDPSYRALTPVIRGAMLGDEIRGVPRSLPDLPVKPVEAKTSPNSQLPHLQQAGRI